MEAECAAQINFFGHQLRHGQAHVATHAHRDQDASRHNDIEASPQRRLAARRFKHGVKLAFVGFVFVKQLGLGFEVNGFVGAHFFGAFQRKVCNVSGHNAGCTGAAQSPNEQRANGPTACDKNLLAQHAASALNGMQAHR